MDKALIDTDILSELIKGIDPIVARNATAYRQAFGLYTTSAITIMEIFRGLRRVQSPQRIARFLQSFQGEEILSFDQAAAQLAGEISGDLERTGQTIGFADPMIAAIALTQGLDLVTGNTAHFERIVRIGHPIALINWRQ